MCSRDERNGGDRARFERPELRGSQVIAMEIQWIKAARSRDDDEDLAGRDPRRASGAFVSALEVMSKPGATDRRSSLILSPR